MVEGTLNSLYFAPQYGFLCGLVKQLRAKSKAKAYRPLIEDLREMVLGNLA